MNDAEAVGVLQGQRDLLGDADRRVEREAPLTDQQAAERAAGHVRHHVVEESIGFAGIEQRQDVRVIELRRDPNLVQEAIRAERHGQLRTQHLDGDLTPMLEVTREIDGGHAAATQFALDSVAASECGSHTVRRVRHAASRCCAADLSARHSTPEPAQVGRLPSHHARPHVRRVREPDLLSRRDGGEVERPEGRAVPRENEERRVG